MFLNDPMSLIFVKLVRKGQDQGQRRQVTGSLELILKVLFIELISMAYDCHQIT